MSTEIERKFLVESIPDDLVIESSTSIRQGYLAEDGNVELRIRMTESTSAMTVKAGSGLQRAEVEVEVASNEAEALWPYTEGRRITKVRHRCTVDGSDVDIDVYEGELAGLIVAEIEFPSVPVAERFVPPSWFVRELTGDKAWSNASLARAGRPA